jgi:ferredoxin-thioredoxin reductase catalytic subunit
MDMNQWTTHLTEYETVLLQVTEIAGRNGYILNPDQERVEKVIGLMTENFISAEKYFCPCKQTHPLNPAADVVCPCPSWKTEIEEDGHCYCRLFYKRNE